MSRVTRRLVMGLALMAAAPAAVAQTATSRALEDFGRYLDAAADLFGEFIIGIRNADAATLRNPQTRASLQRIADTLLDLYTAQSTLVGDLEDYAAAARRGEGAEEVWRGIIAQVRRTAGIVRQVIAIVDATPELNVALTAEQRSILRETLAARTTMLSRLERLPRPSRTAEIAQLEGMNARYRRLIQTLRQIRFVIEEALLREDA